MERRIKKMVRNRGRRNGGGSRGCRENRVKIKKINQIKDNKRMSRGSNHQNGVRANHKGKTRDQLSTG